jgi:hypothetical protein
VILVKEKVQDRMLGAVPQEWLTFTLAEGESGC